MTAEFKDRVAVVTGAGQGIGRAIAVNLLKAECRVACIGRTLDKLASLSAEAGVASSTMLPHAIDIRDDGAVAQAVAESEIKFGAIDYLVNAAGILRPSNLLETSPDEMRETIEVNFIATLQVTQVVARGMVERRSGSIVTIGSNSGTTPRKGLGAYPASKAGVQHAMKCLALSLAEHNVRCNLVSPGSTDTPMQRSYQTDASSLDKVISGDLENYRLGIPLRRMAAPDDVSDLVLFLLSDRARHITMENIVIDGGATLGAR